MNMCNPSQPRTAWQKLLQVGLVLATAFTLLTARAQSNDAGTVTGTVSNTGTGGYLEGAEVRVVGTDLMTTTQRDGRFILSRVPAGVQQIRIFYTGLDAKDVSVTVRGGEINNVAVAMTSDIYTLNAYSVAGQREGNAVSITRQRVADNLKNIVSMDAYGNVADGNIGNFMQNMTGVAVNKEAGDIVGIGLRGAPPELNSVTLDGTRMAAAIAGSTPQGDRAALIDQIPADFIKEIEVTKGNTPDQAADSLGGTVNLITKSAFDFNERVITFKAGLNLNTYREGKVVNQQLAPINLGKYGPTASLTYLNTFGPERHVGLALSGSYSQTTNTRDRVQMTRPNVDNNISTRARQLNDINTRIRGGLSGKLEYRFDETAQIGVSAQLNYFAFDGDRVDWNITAANTAIADYSIVSRAQIEAGAVARTAAGGVAGIAPGFSGTYNELLNATILNRSAHEVKRSHQYKVGVDGRKSWGDSKVTFSASHNPTSYDNNFHGFSPTRTGVGVGYDASVDATRPVYTQTYGPSIGRGADFSQYTASFFVEPDVTREYINSGRIDFLNRQSLGGVAVDFKVGADYRTQNRWLINSYRPSWDYVGADGVVGLNPATKRNDDDIGQFVAPWTYSLFNNKMMVRDSFDLPTVDALFNKTPNYFIPQGASVSTAGIPRRVIEDVGSAYTQAKFNLGALNVLTGVRFEHTAVEATGSMADPQAPKQTQITVGRAYQMWFPSMHLRYTVSPNFLMRASYATSAARPGLAAITPDTRVSYLSNGSGLGSVTVSNTALKPQFTRNYDIDFEYYLQPAGILSAGLFRKDITNYISNAAAIVGSGANNGFDGRYAGFDLNTTSNLGTAQVEGFEFGYNQQLRKLPQPFNGISVFANFTGLRTSGTYANGASELANFVPRTYNAGVSYSNKKFETRVTYHYKSGYLMTYSAAVTSQTRATDDPTVDFNLQYRYRANLSFFLDYINIFNNSPDWWHVDQRHILMSELYGARLNVGVSARY